MNINSILASFWGSVKAYLGNNYLGKTAKAESAKSADSVAWANVSDKPSTYTPSSHTHDDRYYTESEVNSLLDGKANTSGTYSGLTVGNADTATKATNNANGKELSNDIIKGLSVNGKVITYTKLDGSTGTITTQDTNTDTKVTNTLENTTKAYITGTTSAKTNTGTQIFDSGVYLTTTAGQLHADIDFPITEAQVNEILGIS